jgi:hypothetical protein
MRRLLRSARRSAINRDLGETMKRIVLKSAAAALVLCVATTAMAGSDVSPADQKAMHDYSLSMAKVDAMGAAMGDFKKMGANGAALLKRQKAIYDAAKSIADMEAKLGADAQIMAVYKAHGLSVADAVLMPFVLMYAGTVAAYPTTAPQLAQSTSPQQVGFYKQHQKDLKAMTWLSGGP